MEREVVKSARRRGKRIEGREEEEERVGEE
jgi:hypothetical protein